MEFPTDLTGDALRRLHERGEDLAEPREIEFVHVMPTRVAAEQMASRARGLGFAPRLHQPAQLGGPGGVDGSGDVWELIATTLMVPTHGEILYNENRLAQIARDLGGREDGWHAFRTFGTN